MNLLLSIVFLLSNGASDCTCSCTPPKGKEAYDKAHAVITGKVLSKKIFKEFYFVPEDETSTKGYVTGEVVGFLVEVTSTYKGLKETKNLWVLTEPEFICGPALYVGSSFLLYLREDERVTSPDGKHSSNLYSSFCYGTKHISLKGIKSEIGQLRKFYRKSKL